jgi:glycosyltransferase involved in cell wall biosynthesis
MHILHIYKTFYSEGFGGVEQLIRQLGTGLIKHGVKVSVLALSRTITQPTTTIHEGITVHTYPLTMEIASNGISLSAFKHYRKLAKTADILHYHFPWSSGDLLHQLAPKSIPTVLTYHSDIIRQKLLRIFYAPLREIFLHQMDVIIATSPNYMETSPVLRRYRAKTHPIPIGLDEAMYPVPDSQQLATWQQKLPRDFFLFVGALRYYKGLHILLEAARITGLPVVIVGKGKRGEALKAQAQDLPNVHFVGAVNDADKMALLHLCQGFVFPSHLRSEAFGISMLEAAMRGKPMISCEIGTGMSYININGETGITIEPANSIQLAEAMQRLNDDPALRTSFGKNARTRYEAIFTGEAMVQNHLELYQRLLRAGVPT